MGAASSGANEHRAAATDRDFTTTSDSDDSSSADADCHCCTAHAARHGDCPAAPDRHGDANGHRGSPADRLADGDLDPDQCPDLDSNSDADT